MGNCEIKFNKTRKYRPPPVCFITSGAIQLAVPIKVCESHNSLIFFELPKSVNLHTPLVSTKTLAPLMS